MNLIKYRTTVTTRSDLFSLLSEACELEHGLACSYLYTAFSIKKESTDGLTGEQLQHTRKWAAKIFFIAAQEMLHLSQAWNLLNAIGGTPYYFRPNFPQPSKYYPFNVPLKLEPFSFESLQRFILYELPAETNEKEYAKANFGFFSEDDYNYKTVGELYRMIRSGFETISEELLFIGSPDLQMGKEEIDFPEIIKVTNRQSALKAIDMITEQGEGVKDHRENSHYESFKSIERELKEYITQCPGFNPARNVMTNPITFAKTNYSSIEGEVIINDLTREISDIFDDIYNLMLRGLQFAFSFTAVPKLRKHIAHCSILLMVRIIKPFGELLTLLPAFNDPYLKNAGPSFALTRHIPLPNDGNLTVRLFVERGNEIIQRMESLAPKEPRLSQMSKAFKETITMLSSPWLH